VTFYVTSADMAKPSKTFLGTVDITPVTSAWRRKPLVSSDGRARTGTTLSSPTWCPFRLTFVPSLLRGETWHTGSSSECLFSDYFIDPVHHPLPRSRTSSSSCHPYDAFQIDLSLSLALDVRLSMFPLVVVLSEHPD
jgi:hypothetical protein